MMRAEKQIVLDANILLRAVFGTRVLSLLEDYDESVLFHAPDICFAEVNKHITPISERRRIDPSSAFELLERVSDLVQIVDESFYEDHKASAIKRIGHRDMSDWPIVAAALFLNCPIWTEDRDFFGIGVPTWTSQTIKLYLRDT